MFLSLSICTCLGISFQFGVSLRTIPQWFDKKRAAAFGIQSASSPLFGLIMPFIITPMYRTLGHQWYCMQFWLLLITKCYSSFFSGLDGKIFTTIKIFFLLHTYHRIFQIFAFLSLATSAIGIAFLKDQPIRKTKEAKAKNFDPSVLKSINLCHWLFTEPLDMSGRYIVYTFLPCK